MIDCSPDNPTVHPGTITVIEMHNHGVKQKPIREFPEHMRFHHETVELDGKVCEKLIPVTLIKVYLFGEKGLLSDQDSPQADVQSMLIEEYDKDGNMLKSTRMKKSSQKK